MRRAQAGSDAAFTELYARFSGYVHAIALSLADPMHAPDIVQETFMKACTRLRTLRDPAAFGGWIAAIARRQAMEARVSAPVEPLRDVMVPPGLDDALDAHRVLAAIARIPEAYRETLVLRLVQGCTGPEIAELTGLTHGSVRVNLHRGMALLRAELGVSE